MTKKIFCVIFWKFYPERNAIYLIKKMQKAKNIMIKKYYQALLVDRYNIFCGINAEIGDGLQLPHPNGIVIGSNVKIGNNCIIYQQVTIGSSKLGDVSYGKQPTIGNDVILYSGAKIIGNINVADKCVVGANSVLLRDTEVGWTYAGVPAVKTSFSGDGFDIADK